MQRRNSFLCAFLILGLRGLVVGHRDATLVSRNPMVWWGWGGFLETPTRALSRSRPKGSATNRVANLKIHDVTAVLQPCLLVQRLG